MSDDVPVDIPAPDTSSPEKRRGRPRLRKGTGEPKPPRVKKKRVRPRLRKRRLLLLLIPLTFLAAVSTVFGMMMAVASDLPALENRQEYKDARNSTIVDVNGKPIGVLASNNNRILVTSTQIAPIMKFAVVAIEDQRFYENSGVDLKGMARALVQDVIQQKAAQGASTITQQFVKNAMQEQNHRTILEKLKEAALAYHLTRKWSKDKILTEYLNAIYFGNGAYGIESAARTYFGSNPLHAGCGTKLDKPCAEELYPAEAALLAGIIASPSLYDPVAHPQAARARRNIVLEKMLQQHRLTQLDYDQAIRTPLPTAAQVRPPTLDTKVPYFVSWVRQQLVDRYRAREAFEGGLKIQTTIDLQLQKAAEQSVRNYLSDPNGPTASIVVLDNKTGEVRAMVGGSDYDKAPFNLATQGQRQPGSAMKPFILATALERGIGPDSVWNSAPQDFIVPNSGGKEHFTVRNDTNSYSGPMSLASALTYSDNTVFSQVGLSKDVGTKRIAKTAWKMGIRTPISTNPAMTLGGLKEGVTPLDMAHAYQTIANGGVRTDGSLGASNGGPVGIRRVLKANGQTLDRNKVEDKRVLSPEIDAEMQSIMQTVVTNGTAMRAQLPNGEFAAGKTGTTSGNIDAWFVGFTKRYTAAVWVGYPQGSKSMAHDFDGGPVEGGTYPALIWHDFMVAAGVIDAERDAIRAQKDGKPVPDGTTGDLSGADAVPAPDTSGGGGDTGGTDTTGGDTGAGGTTGGDTGGTGGGTTGGGTTGGGDTGGGTTGGGTGGDTGGGDTGGTGGGTGGGDTGGTGGGTGDAGGGGGGNGETGGATAG